MSPASDAAPLASLHCGRPASRGSGRPATGGACALLAAAGAVPAHEEIFTAPLLGSYDHSFDMSLSSSYNPAFIAANGGTVATAFSALANGMETDRAYLNIHDSNNPGGEVRGILVLSPAPEPSGVALMGLGLAALLAFARRRRA